MKLQLVKGSTDVTLLVFVQDASSPGGEGLVGLAHDASGLACYYVRPGSAAAQLTLATQTVTGAHADGGFVEIDASNMPGWYRLDLADAILASGVDSVGVHLEGAADMAPLPLEIQLTGVDPNDGTGGGISRLDANVTGVFDEATADHTSAGSFGESLQPLYHAAVDFAKDDAVGKDDYTVTWYRDGVPITSSVSSATIQVVQRADGADLVAATAMTEVGSTGTQKYDESIAGNRVTPGEAALVVVSATIDGSTRAWRELISRDSTS